MGGKEVPLVVRHVAIDLKHREDRWSPVPGRRRATKSNWDDDRVSSA